MRGWPYDLPLGPLVFFGLTDLLVVVAMVYDRITRGRVHPALVWGGLFLVVSQVVRLAVSGTGVVARPGDLADPLRGVNTAGAPPDGSAPGCPLPRKIWRPPYDAISSSSFAACASSRARADITTSPSRTAFS